MKNEEIENMELTAESKNMLGVIMSDSEVSTADETTVIKVTKEAKRARRVGKVANMLAKQAGDPAYTKLVDLATRLRDVRMVIRQKYGAKAISIVKSQK
jgi:tRNA A37 threonylcarbamoyladenosine synthetase subunit TsaC/SUA5/YrdC